MQYNKNVKIITISAIFITMDIIFARFFTFTIPGFVKADLQSLVAILCGYILGPFWASISLIASDLLGATINSGSMGIIFGFTISAACRGFLYGLLFKNKKNNSIIYYSVSIAFVYILIDVLLNNLWLSMTTSSNYLPLLIGRLLPRSVILIIIIVLAIPCINFINKYNFIQKIKES